MRPRVTIKFIGTSAAVHRYAQESAPENIADVSSDHKALREQPADVLVILIWVVALDTVDS